MKTVSKHAFIRICATLALCIGLPVCAAEPAAAASYRQVHVLGGKGGAEGAGPYGELALGPDGNFYGVTFYGGTQEFRCDCSVGGTIFRMTPTGAVTVLHVLFAPDSGTGSSGGLTLGIDGRFYGLATGGGAYGGGTAYRIDMDGHFTLLHSFGGGSGRADDGAQPYLGRLVQGPDGNFYGVTSRGGEKRFGTLFRMTPAGKVTVLHAFAGAPGDGATPRGGLMLASDGNFYGTTLCGGMNEKAGGCGGTLYRWSASSGFGILHHFDADPAKATGYAPQATLTERGGGLYGTTTLGGSAGAGTVFRLPLAGGAPTVLHSFQGGASADPPNTDGMAPAGRMVLGKNGNLYGTTSNGGPNQRVHPEGDGTIFQVTAQDDVSVVYAFGAGGKDGSHPLSGLTPDADGVLFGVTETGDGKFTGTIYSWNPAAR